MSRLLKATLLSSTIALAGCEDLDTLLSDLDTSLSGQAIANTGGEVAPVQEFRTIDSEAQITREELARLTHVAPGNSTQAMHHFLNLPYAVAGNTEYYPLENDPTTWIGVQYDSQGNYVGYTFSAQNYSEGM
jgi:hypothetical protein